MEDTQFIDSAEFQLFDLVGKAKKQVVLVSPFLTIPVALRLASIARVSTAEWSILTNLNPAAAAGGYLSIDGLRELQKAGVVVGHLGRLHAKVYLADERALVGSANLTQTGLGITSHSNVELSVRIEGDAIDDLNETIKRWRNIAAVVDSAAIDRFEREVRALPRAVAVTYPIGLGHVDDRAALSMANLIADARERKLWVKAQYGAPNAEKWNSAHWFSSSKRARPSFAPGDLVLIYSKDVGACYAIVEVTDVPANDPQFVEAQGYSLADSERWPWVNSTMPRLVPNDGSTVAPADLGFSSLGLQVGHRKLGIAEFVEAIHALSGGNRF